jgi:hypothetical protein
MAERTYPYKMHFAPALNAELERIAKEKGLKDGVADVLREGLLFLLLEERLKQNGGAIHIEHADGTRLEIITPE